MGDQPQAIVIWPGIEVAWEDVSGTDVLGIAPSKWQIEFYGELGTPALNGDLQFIQGTNRIVIPNCRLVKAFFEDDSGGAICRITIEDERWAWQIGGVINGQYNVRLPDNQLDSIERAKSFYDLVVLLFAAMGVTNYDASILTTAQFSGERPPVNWDVANPAQELQRLLDDNELVLAPKRSNNTWVICLQGVGANLPPLDGSIPFQDPGLGVDPKEAPDAIRVYGAPIRYQVRLLLEAVGKDILDPSKPEAAKADGSWKPINDLSYAPTISPIFQTFPDWEHEDDDMEGVSNARVVQPDGSYQVARDLARSTVFKCFRVKADGDGNITIPGYVSPTNTSVCTLEQLIFHNELVDTYIDADGTRFVKPAFCDFVGIHLLLEDNGENTKGGTRVEVQTNTELDDPNDYVTFSMNSDNEPFHLLTSPHGIITFSVPMKAYPTTGSTDEPNIPASIWLTCTVTVRDPDTWQPKRFQKTIAVRGAALPSDQTKFIQPLRRDDIQQWFKTSYFNLDTDPTGNVSQTITHNLEFVNPQADYYLNSTLASYETPDCQTVTFQGIWPLDLDGAINQVSYSISKSGADTKVSSGTEHDWTIPGYRERLDRIARSGVANANLKADINKIKANLPTL